MNYISDVLFWISTGMLVPVIILLIFFFLRALLLLGGFFGQYLVKRKSGAEIREQMNTLTLDNIDTLGDRLPKNKQAVIVSYMKKLVDNRQSKAQVNRILDQYAQFVEKDLSLPSTLLKMGPMLGLMGTLIPMGPALVGRRYFFDGLQHAGGFRYHRSGIVLCSHRFRNQADQEPLVYRGYEQSRVYGRPVGGKVKR